MSLVVHTKGEGPAAAQFDPDLCFAFTKCRIWRWCAWASFPEHFVRADGSEAGGTSVSTCSMEGWLGGRQSWRRFQGRDELPLHLPLESPPALLHTLQC